MRVIVEVAINAPFSNGILSYNWNFLEISPKIGLRVKVPLRNIIVKGVIILVKEIPKHDKLPYSLKEVHSFMDEESILGKQTLPLAEWLSQFCLCNLGESLSFILPWASREKPLKLDDKKFPSFLSSKSVILNDEQTKVQNTILNGKSQSFYLKGVTGSGKSETLIHTALKFLEEKKQSVLYLVPEITLVHSLLKSIKRVIRNYPIFTLNSSLTASEQLHQWKKIQKSSLCCVIGVRSAAFAPFSNLGLIIMDEEQETSYKSETTPRYYTRHLIFMLQKYFKSILVLTSATPSLECYYALKKGLLTPLSLSKRIGNALEPEVKVIEIKDTKNFISLEMEEELLKNYSLGKQSLLFLNRRGFLSVYLCSHCGYQKKCPDCSVALTYHKNQNCLKCHHCNYREFISKEGISCPQCSTFPMNYSKIGTEFIEESLKFKFPQIKIVRLDTDVSGENRLKSQEILKEFESGKWDILLGTQMIAKGLNFRNVDLVGIILADSTLNLPDFRSYEKTYSLIRQVIGRSGRFSQTGKVILQTFQPNHPIIQMAQKGDDETFYEGELSLREVIDFPPFSYLFRIVMRSPHKEKAQQEIQNLFILLKKNALSYQTICIYEASECVIEKIAKNWRYQILLKGKYLNDLHFIVEKATSQWLKTQTSKNNIYLERDPYPVNFL